MISRTEHLKTLSSLVSRYPVVAITGARQVGKTTLARAFARDYRGPVTVFDLEDPRHMARLEDPMLTLQELKGLVIIDEIQAMPGLFKVLRVLADRKPLRARFLVLGSASPDLLRQTSETLAGRIAYLELGGFNLGEIGSKNYNRLWLRGGFPRSYLARSHSMSHEWRRQFIRTFLEKDIPQLGFRISAVTLRRFWTMLANYHGRIWNASEFGRSFGVADTTVRNYLDLLTSAMVVRQLPPWHENISKRQVKAPKVFIADSGIVHALLNLTTQADVESHPILGASWEGFVQNEVINRLGARREECFFWATYSGAELDLLIVRGRKRLGFEIKRTSSPSITKSMSVAIEDLKLNQLYVIHAGKESFPMADRVRAVALARLLSDLKPSML
jgi:hypothetical protein